MGRVSVEGLGKAYKRYPNRLSRLAEWLTPWRGPRHELHWVLRDITFNIEPGDALGIIGINGAGKSTLLKMITGTTQPTEGSVALTGHVAAMLELGMGFHPDFTGRQNVYMAGQLLGLNVDVITSLMPEIEAFAEIGDHIDQPVRVYSSGMQMRLAFSVATARRPDILIVDEALSVGDAYFGGKCMQRIREYRTEGTTLLIVSHDKQAIQSICDKAILLEAGRLVFEGHPESVMDYYNASLVDRANRSIEQHIDDDGNIETISGTGEARVIDVRFVSANGAHVEVVEVGTEVSMIARVRLNAPIPYLVFGYMVKDRLGQCVFGTNTQHTKQPVEDLAGGEELVYTMTFPVNLGPGEYSIATALTSSDTHLINNYEWHDRAAKLQVVNSKRPEFIGSTWLDNQVAIERKGR